MSIEALEPSEPPVTVDEAKVHLRIDATDADTLGLLSALILAALEYVERETRQQLMPREYRLRLDAFPSGGELRINKSPLKSVEAVKYIDATGAEQTLNPATYTVDTASKPGRIVLKPGRSWPQTDGSAAFVSVEFTAGYADAASVPALLTLAVKMLVGHFYEHPEAVIDRRLDTVPMAVESIINLHAFPEAVG